MPHNRATLKTDEKLEVLLLARKILGPKGENWIKGAWRATAKENLDSYLSILPGETATCWCLDGAIDEAAYRLGYRDQPRSNGKIQKATSLLKLVRTKVRAVLNSGDVVKYDNVVTFNDTQQEFKPVRKLLDERIKQLRDELKTE